MRIDHPLLATISTLGALVALTGPGPCAAPLTEPAQGRPAPTFQPAATPPAAAAPDISDAATALGYSTKGAQRTALVIDGEPLLKPGPIPFKQTLLTVNLRYGRAGIMLGRAAGDTLSIEPDTLVFLTAFHKHGDSAAPAQMALCGPGHGGLIRLPMTVCMVSRPDGQVQLQTGEIIRVDEDPTRPIHRSDFNGAPSWYVSGLVEIYKPHPAPPAPVGPADASRLPTLQLSLVPTRATGGVKLFAYVSQAAAEGPREYVRSFDLPAVDGVARLPFGRFVLRMDVAESGVTGSWEPAPAPPDP